jgi:TPR repeat protein
VRLRAIFDADIREHGLGLRHGTPEYIAMRDRDRERRREVAAMIDAGAVTTAEDLFQAARIFQHGDEPADARMAFDLARQSAERNHRPARWLAAAAYDRWLMYQGLPQKYGTNYVSDGKRQRLWDVNPATTDDERALWDVPPLAEQLRKAEEATRRDPQSPVGDDAPWWLKQAIERWRLEDE